MAIDRDIQEELAELYASGTRTVPHILTRLEGDERFANRLPSDRSIYRYLAKIKSAYTAAEQELDRPFRLRRQLRTQFRGEDIETFLVIVRKLYSRPFAEPLTMRTVHWVALLRHSRLGADGEELGLWHTAIQYARRERWALVEGQELDTPDLDAYVVFAPWESAEADLIYRTAITVGLVPEPFSPPTPGYTDSDLEQIHDVWESNDFEDLEARIQPQMPEDQQSLLRLILTAKARGLLQAVQLGWSDEQIKDFAIHANEIWEKGISIEYSRVPELHKRARSMSTVLRTHEVRRGGNS